MPEVGVGVDAAGNAVGVWQRQDTEGPNRIWSNRFRLGAGWGAAQEIDSGGRGDAYAPRVAVDPTGNAIAVWAEFFVEGFTVREWTTWANRLTPNQGWGNALRIQPMPSAPQASAQRISTGSELAPQVGVDAAGSAIVVWLQSDIRLTFQNPPRSLVARRFLVDSGWADPEEIGGPDSQMPRIAVNTSGTAVAVWRASRIWARIFAAGSGWQEARVLGDGVEPEVAVDASGNAVAVWETDVIRGSAFQAGIGWTPSQAISIKGGSLADAAMDPGGNALVVWGEFVSLSGPEAVLANRFLRNVGWGSEERVGLSSNYGPQVVIARDGAALVVWKAWQAAATGVFSSRFVRDSGWTAPQQISATLPTSYPRFETPPAIAIDPSGNVVAIWSEPEGSRSSIWASRYRAN